MTAAFAATFSDMRQVKGRKVYQLTFEVPAEKVDAALEILGGAPHSEKEVWCAIARLQNSGAEPVNPAADSASSAATQKGSVRERSQGSTIPSATPPAVERPPGVKRSWGDYSYASQVAMRCSDNDFLRYIGKRWVPYEYGEPIMPTSLEAEKYILMACGVSRKRDILPGTPAGDKWAKLDSDYQLWKQGARV